MKLKTNARPPAQATEDHAAATSLGQQHARGTATRNPEQNASRLVGSDSRSDLGRPVNRSSGGAARPPVKNIVVPASSVSVVSNLSAPGEVHPEAFDVPLEICVPAASVSPDSTRSVESELTRPEQIRHQSHSSPLTAASHSETSERASPEFATSAVPAHTEPGTKAVRVEQEALRRIGALLGMEFDEASVSTHSTNSLIGESLLPEEMGDESPSGSFSLTSEQILRRLGALLNDFDKASVSTDAPDSLVSELTIPEEIRHESLSGNLPPTPQEMLTRIGALLDIGSDESTVTTHSTRHSANELSAMGEFGNESAAGLSLPMSDFGQTFPGNHASALPALRSDEDSGSSAYLDELSMSSDSTWVSSRDMNFLEENQQESRSGDLPTSSDWATFRQAYPEVPAPAVPANDDASA